MGTRIRDLASNTDSSIILDSGTSYVKRDDQTTPVYRGVTSTNITGVGGWTWLNREQRDAAGAWYSQVGWMEANVADWGIPVGATAVMFNHRRPAGSTVVTQRYDWYRNDTISTGGAPDTTAAGFHDRWLQFGHTVGYSNDTGQIVGWPTPTGRCLIYSHFSDGPELYPIGYQMTAGVSATQTNLDAALARITELENRPAGGRLVSTYTFEGVQSTVPIPALEGWQPGYKVVVTGICAGSASNPYSFIWSQNRILTEEATVYATYRLSSGGSSGGGSLSINESTGEITLSGFQGVVVFLSLYSS